MRLALLVAIALGAFGCGSENPQTDVGRIDGGGGDGGDLDTSGLDAPALDTSGLDAPAADTAGLDAPGTDASGADGGLVSMPCVATGACDPFDPTSCSDGESCRLGATGTECMALFSTVAAAGEVCTRSDGCEPGTLCLDFGEGFVCHLMCPDGSIGFCGAGQACGGGLGDTCVRVCRPTPVPCDIYAQDCVDPELACVLVTHADTGERYTGCRPPGPLTEGETCGTGVGTCERGLVCIRVTGVSSCRSVCSDDGPDCTAPQACTGVTTGWGVRYCSDP